MSAAVSEASEGSGRDEEERTDLSRSVNSGGKVGSCTYGRAKNLDRRHPLSFCAGKGERIILDETPVIRAITRPGLSVFPRKRWRVGNGFSKRRRKKSLYLRAMYSKALSGFFLWTKVAQESLLFSHGACLIHSRNMTSFSINALVRKSNQKPKKEISCGRYRLVCQYRRCVACIADPPIQKRQ